MNSLKRVLKWLQFNKRRRRKSIKNEVFEIPFHKNKTYSIFIPDIQNKTFNVSKWFVKVGDIIQEGQIICELETNSITIELESLHTGKLVLITNSKGKLKPGDSLCKIEKID